MELIQIWKEKGLPVSKGVKLLSVPRSTYYSSLSLRGDHAAEKKRTKGRHETKTTFKFICLDGMPKKITVPDETVNEEIINLFSNEFVCYGYHKVTWFLRRKEYIINHKKVYRLMLELHLLRPKLIKRGNNVKRVKDRIVIATQPNEIWEIDIKYIYIHGERRNAFVCSIIDCFTREIISYHFGRHCLKGDVKRIIDEAIRVKNISLANIKLRIRCDNGCQFISTLIREYLSSIGIQQEHIHLASPQENAYIESFHSIIHFEFTQRFEFDTFEECAEKLKEWVNFYNNERIHSAIGYRTPRECYEEYEEKHLKLKIDSFKRSI